MDRNKCKTIREQLQAILDSKPLPGHRVQISNARFDDTSVTFKLEVAEVADDGVVLDQFATAFRNMAEYCGLQPDDLGKEITLKAERYRITGAKWGTKFPVLVQRLSDGRSMMFKTPAIQRALGRPVTAGEN
jgi:hypothetical protein